MPGSALHSPLLLLGFCFHAYKSTMPTNISQSPTECTCYLVTDTWTAVGAWPSAHNNPTRNASQELDRNFLLCQTAEPSCLRSVMDFARCTIFCPALEIPTLFHPRCHLSTTPFIERSRCRWLPPSHAGATASSHAGASSSCPGHLIILWALLPKSGPKTVSKGPQNFECL